MRRSRRVAAIVVASWRSAQSWPAGSSPGRDRQRRGGARADAQRGGPRHRAKVDNLVRRMTLDEKLQQIQLLSDGQVNEQRRRRHAREGRPRRRVQPRRPGAHQRAAAHRGREVAAAHPDPVRLRHDPRLPDDLPGRRWARRAASIPSVATTDATIGARESATVGLKQIYSPMVDVSHEPRWGRIAEGGGEDPYLGSAMAAARVKGAQGGDYSAKRQGRHERQALRRRTASPRAAATTTRPTCPSSGCGTCTCRRSRPRSTPARTPSMCSFNAISGVPGCANQQLETDILKKEWGFDGFIESDYTAVAELRACPPKTPDEGPCGHGVAADGPDAGAQALNAGTDSEMVVDQHPRLRQAAARAAQDLDEADRRRGAPHPARQVPRRAVRQPVRRRRQGEGPGELPHAGRPRRGAQGGAGRSMVLLKNAGSTLPLDPTKKTAVIGPLGQVGPRHARPVVGPRRGRRRGDRVRRHQRAEPGRDVRAGLHAAQHRAAAVRPGADCASTPASPRRWRPRRSADQVVLALGETREMSGEAASRTNIDLPGRQEEPDRGDQGDRQAVRGRAVQRPAADARRRRRRSRRRVLEAWFPGVEAGNAVADVLFGKVNPGGKLPVSFPQRVGQVPIYYNHEPTGRPCDATQKYNSRYRDLPTCAPLYEFGYGLSYTKFEVSNLRLSSSRVSRHGSVTASVDVHEHRLARRATRSCSSTSTTRSRASRSRCAACAASSA